MKLSKEEKDLIAKHRAKEEIDKVKKIGYLINNLYTVIADSSSGARYELDNWYFDTAERDTEIQSFTEWFQLACPAGTQFDCFLDEYGNEEWYDTINYGIECMDADWARKYLRDIKPVKKGRK